MHACQACTTIKSIATIIIKLNYAFKFMQNSIISSNDQSLHNKLLICQKTFDALRPYLHERNRLFTLHGISLGWLEIISDSCS